MTWLLFPPVLVPVVVVVVVGLEVIVMVWDTVPSRNCPATTKMTKIARNEDEVD